MSVSAVPAPFSVSPSWSWDGDDGRWSTFSISVGTPPQSFRVLPSTTGAETWVPIPDGCKGILSNVANCGTLRGVNSFDGSASTGFETDASSTWDLIGIYELATEQSLWGPTGNQGLYGLDTVSLDSDRSGKSAKLPGQTVAGVATANVWLGSLGLGTASANFSVESGNIPSLLDSMKSQKITPSISFGYTAGASYSSSQAPGSLILGGYDKARFTPSDLDFPIPDDSKRTLPLSIKSIVAENAFGGTVSLLSGGNAVSTTIDTTVSLMWMPQNVCDLFEQAFGLTYDSITGLYVVNSTVHNHLKQMNPSVTFTLSSDSSSSSTTNIELPYAAFDLQAGIPLYNTSTNYFPLRVAANESQQVLGRAFMQEAYVIVDWERQNFTIGQAIHQNSTTNIVPILSSTYQNPTQSSSLHTTAIIGIAVGIVAAIVLIGVAVFFAIRSRRRRRAAALAKEKEDGLTTELHHDDVRPAEMMSAQVYELQEGENSRHELMAKQVSEMQGESLEQELAGDGERLGWYGGNEKKQHMYELA